MVPDTAKSQMHLRLLGVSVLGALAFFVAPLSTASTDVSESQIMGMHHGESGLPNGSGYASGFKDARQRAVMAAGETYASQVAYCEGVHHWNRWAMRHKAVFDKAYDFASLLLDDGRVLPPIILQDDRSFRQQGRNMAITAQTTWHILHEGKIVSIAPNWRGYLIQSCGKPLMPNGVLLPKNAKDEIAWKTGVSDGWKEGLSAAKSGFEYGLHRLTRDYKGMLRFWWLSQRGIVQAPILSSGNVGVRVNGRTLNIGERIFRLTDAGSFNMQHHWKPVIQMNNDPKQGLPLIQMDK